MPVSVCLCIVSYRWVHHLVVSSLVLDLEVRGGDADGVVPGELGDASGGLPGGGAGGEAGDEENEERREKLWMK